VVKLAGDVVQVVEHLARKHDWFNPQYCKRQRERETEREREKCVQGKIQNNILIFDIK
jgi:hypothetical protein